MNISAPTSASDSPPASREMPVPALIPVLASSAGMVLDDASKVPDAETLKYVTLVTVEPSEAVEVKVSECHPASRPEGIVTEVVTAPFDALPEASVTGVERKTTSYGAVACNPEALIATFEPAIV